MGIRKRVGYVFYWKGYGRYVPYPAIAKAFRGQSFKIKRRRKTTFRTIRSGFASLDTNLRVERVAATKLFTSFALLRLTTDAFDLSASFKRVGIITLWKVSGAVTYDGLNMYRKRALELGEQVVNSYNMEEIGRLITNYLSDLTHGVPLKGESGVWFIPERDVEVMRRMQEALYDLSTKTAGFFTYRIPVNESADFADALAESVTVTLAPRVLRTCKNIQTIHQKLEVRKHGGLQTAVNYANRRVQEYNAMVETYSSIGVRFPTLRRLIAQLQLDITHVIIASKFQKVDTKYVYQVSPRHIINPRRPFNGSD